MDNEKPAELRHGVTRQARTRAVAAYMISHNDKHISALADLVDGADKATAKLLLDAIGSFEMGNTQLRQLLEHLDNS